MEYTTGKKNPPKYPVKPAAGIYAHAEHCMRYPRKKRTTAFLLKTRNEKRIKDSRKRGTGAHKHGDPDRKTPQHPERRSPRCKT